jgi:hypothetical protein
MNLKCEYFRFPDGYSVLFIRSKYIVRHMWLIPRKVKSGHRLFLCELWRNCLLKTSYIHDTNIFPYLRILRIFTPGLWSSYTATTLAFQTFLYTCFDTYVVLLYRSSVSCGRMSIALVPFPANEVNPLYAYHILALKNNLYLYGNSNAHLQICWITYHYCSPTYLGHSCDHNHGALQK